MEEDFEPSSFMVNRSAWDNGENFSTQYQEIHGELIESMGTGTSLIDNNKPLLRKTNSPKPNNSKADSPISDSNKSSTSSKNIPKETFLKPSRKQSFESSYDKSNESDTSNYEEIGPKSHIRKFHTRENEFSDYQFSGTSDSDDNFLVNNKDDKYDLDEIEKLMQLEMKRANNNKTNNNSKQKTASNPKQAGISDAGKRMIRCGIGMDKASPKPSKTHSRYSTSPSSTIDTNEYPTLEESRQALNKLSPGKSKQTIPFNQNNQLNQSSQFNPDNSPNFPAKARGRGQILRRLIEQPQVRRLSPGLSDISAPRQIDGIKSAYDFPSDDELLVTPHVVPAVDGAPVVGQNVSVVKRHNK